MPIWSRHGGMFGQIIGQLTAVETLLTFTMSFMTLTYVDAGVCVCDRV
jgi:hypothetical protein